METNRVEQGHGYYDDVMLNSKRFTCHYRKSQYYNIWLRSLKHLNEGDNIIELGCGTGQYAQLLYDKKFTNYIGIDFSSKLIKAARNKSNQVFYCHDINKYSYMEMWPYNTIVAMEVLEHIKDDIDLLNNINKSTKIIMSLPSQKSEPSHVRYFRNKKQIKERYGDIIDIMEIEVFERSEFRWYLIYRFIK